MLSVGVHVKLYPRVSDTRPIPDGYGHGYKIIPAGIVAGGYTQSPRVWLRAGICHTRSESDPLPSLISAYLIYIQNFMVKFILL
jgi:hypothetical protein